MNFTAIWTGGPRKARVAPAGALHHIIVCGIERRKFFWDAADRDAFAKRLRQVLKETDTDVVKYAQFELQINLIAQHLANMSAKMHSY